MMNLTQGKTHRSLDNRVKEAEQLAAKHKGVLPNVHWLHLHHSALSTAMQRHPDAFAHIKQDRKTKTIAEHVRTAEALARQHRNIVPRAGWMQRHYPAVASCMHAYPESFSHLKREFKRSTPEELVEVAVSLARQNDGVLPSISWCNTHRHSGIRSTLYNHRKLFLKRFRKIGKARNAKFVLKETGKMSLAKAG